MLPRNNPSLFHVVHVGADGELSVGDFVELLSGYDHGNIDGEIRLGNFGGAHSQLAIVTPFSATGSRTLTEVPCALESISTRPL